MDNREIKGMAIIAKGDLPIAISQEEFLVPSQSGNGNYKVKHFDTWNCNCQDFIKRGLECKHIKATKFFLKLRNKTEVNDFDIETEVNPEQKNECPKCHSIKVVKAGLRKNKARTVQKWQCNDCKAYFVLEPIKYCKANAKIITLTMDLFYKGLSLRDISDTIKQFYGFEVCHETVRNWIRNFTNKINDYTNSLKPETSKQFHTDEQFLKCKGKIVYAFNTIDKDTRFLLASTISQSRSIAETRKHFQAVKQQTKDERPYYILTDSMQSYHKSINKEFRTMIKETEHIKLKDFEARQSNNLIERYHNDFREFDKVRRGFKEINATQDYANGFKIQHNFIHKNPTIKTTPAEASGINLNLKQNKWLDLIQLSNKRSN